MAFLLQEASIVQTYDLEKNRYMLVLLSIPLELYKRNVSSGIIQSHLNIISWPTDKKNQTRLLLLLMKWEHKHFNFHTFYCEIISRNISLNKTVSL